MEEWKRLDEARRAPARTLDYEAARINDKQAELWNTPNEWYADLNGLDVVYQADMLSLASRRPRRKPRETTIRLFRFLDRRVRYMPHRLVWACC